MKISGVRGLDPASLAPLQALGQLSSLSVQSGSAPLTLPPLQALERLSLERVRLNSLSDLEHLPNLKTLALRSAEPGLPGKVRSALARRGVQLTQSQ